ncbi:hypothetical protein [Rheinheimera texasensis]|uniref:hypothetical protein n=1 Tax=Rheinheimera texasensis TaxID=306205 RepID=UPI0032B29484
MQPDKTTREVAAQTIASGQDLLQQVQALFDLPQLPPVAMAFPAVISASGVVLPSQAGSDIDLLFAQQEQLFAGAGLAAEHNFAQNNAQTAAADTAVTPQPDPAPAIPETTVESAELQAIRQLYASD